jgi:hypothetical protein
MEARGPKLEIGHWGGKGGNLEERCDDVGGGVALVPKRVELLLSSRQLPRQTTACDLPRTHWSKIWTATFDELAKQSQQG